jgi:hypothetical protein
VSTWQEKRQHCLLQKGHDRLTFRSPVIEEYCIDSFSVRENSYLVVRIVGDGRQKGCGGLHYHGTYEHTLSSCIKWIVVEQHWPRAPDVETEAAVAACFAVPRPCARVTTIFPCCSGCFVCRRVWHVPGLCFEQRGQDLD